MADIKGSAVGLYVMDGSPASWKLAVCGTDLSFSGSTETQDASSKCGTSSTPGNASWTMSGSGIAKVDANPTTEVSAEDFLAIWEGKEVKEWLITDDTDAPTIYRRGSGFLSSIEETYNNGDVARFTFTITGTSDIDLTA